MPQPSASFPQLPTQFADDALLDINEVEAIVKLKKSAIYRRIAEGSFPDPRRLSSRCSRWKSSEIRAFLASLDTPREAA